MKSTVHKHSLEDTILGIERYFLGRLNSQVVISGFGLKAGLIYTVHEQTQTSPLTLQYDSCCVSVFLNGTYMVDKFGPTSSSKTFQKKLEKEVAALVEKEHMFLLREAAWSAHMPQIREDVNNQSPEQVIQALNRWAARLFQ